MKDTRSTDTAKAKQWRMGTERFLRSGVKKTKHSRKKHQLGTGKPSTEVGTMLVAGRRGNKWVTTEGGWGAG
ncbi:hypothetical protein BaRGS_00009196 [Batillaria attramentaria]|uniref:Uncharacterized protein n=1 Tax=Batillaria attramentaria TaxID=370345 RepID=A0ABD0LJ46_9CAEN